MLWLYTRDAETLQAETVFDNATSEYVLILRWADGRVESERFAEVAAFQARLDGLRGELETARWNQIGGPQLLQHGWPEGDETKH